MKTSDVLLPQDLRILSDNILSELLAQAELHGATGCWIWSGKVNPAKYPLFFLQSTPEFGHSSNCNGKGRWVSPGRLLKRLYDVSGSESGYLRWICGNRKCVNPDHAVAARCTPLPNHAHGERHGRAKLTKAQVTEIRERIAAGEKIITVALVFGLSSGTVSKIVNRRLWSRS